jgi:uncharacterized protein YjbJ (UPF0337 family)
VKHSRSFTAGPIHTDGYLAGPVAVNSADSRGNLAAAHAISDRRSTMKSGTKDQAEGKFHKMKGKAKEIAGRIGRDSDLEAEGKGERLAGKVQEKIGQVKKVLGKG